MTERCPNCGYCPTCKRANPVYPTVAPQSYSFGYWCACGMWVAYGSWHSCNTYWPTCGPTCGPVTNGASTTAAFTPANP